MLPVLKPRSKPGWNKTYLLVITHTVQQHILRPNINTNRDRLLSGKWLWWLGLSVLVVKQVMLKCVTSSVSKTQLSDNSTCSILQNYLK